MLQLAKSTKFYFNSEVDVLVRERHNSLSRDETTDKKQTMSSAMYRDPIATICICETCPVSFRNRTGSTSRDDCWMEYAATGRFGVWAAVRGGSPRAERARGSRNRLSSYDFSNCSDYREHLGKTGDLESFKAEQRPKACSDSYLECSFEERNPCE